MIDCDNPHMYYIHVHMHSHTHTHSRAHTHTHTRAHTHAHARIYTHACTHKHTIVHILQTIRNLRSDYVSVWARILNENSEVPDHWYYYSKGILLSHIHTIFLFIYS